MRSPGTTGLSRKPPAHLGADRIVLAKDVFGTGHGLCKLPYVRDTRRSIGIGDFVLTIDDLIGDRNSPTAKVFADRVALGAYPADVHFLVSCKYPGHVREHRDTRPFYIPYRALTHRDWDNLLVAGKTMAQSFMANSATRLHPIEWSSGTAAGVIAAFMHQQRMTTTQAYQDIDRIQALVNQKTPIDWSL